MVAGHGLVGVGHREDARFERDVAPAEPERIAGPVGSLVMRVHPAGGFGEAGAFQNLSSDLGVALHLLPFVIGKGSRLEQDVIRQADLAQVVNDAREAYLLGPRRVEA